MDFLLADIGPLFLLMFVPLYPPIIGGMCGLVADRLRVPQATTVRNRIEARRAPLLSAPHEEPQATTA